MRPYTTLLLDLDNTLMDFDKAEKAAFYAAFSVSGSQPSDEIYQMYHEINDSLWKKLERGEIKRTRLFDERFEILFSRLGRPSADVKEISRSYFRFLSKERHLLPGATDVCRILATHYRLAIITNGTATVQYSRFYGSGLEEYFSGFFVSEEIGADKPSPRFFHAVYDALGDSDPAHYCVIGDSLSSDIAGATAMGMDAVWMTQKKDTPDIPRTHILRDIRDLPDYFLCN